MKKYILSTHILILLFIVTIFLLPTRFTFLAWNIFLAVIPFDIALCVKKLTPKHKLLVIPLTLLWLIFYPNTIYMITDFAHLSAIGTGLINSTQILNYGLLAIGIFLGVSLGISSARIMLQTWLPTSSYIVTFGVFSIISILSSYAIYMGRFLRLNSWDLLLDIHNVILQMNHALSVHSLHFILVFTFVQIFLMIINVTLNPYTQNNN